MAKQRAKFNPRKMYKEMNHLNIFGKLSPNKNFEKFYYIYPKQKCRVINN